MIKVNQNFVFIWINWERFYTVLHYTGDNIRQLSKAELVIKTRRQIREIITPYGGGKMRQTKTEQRDQHYEESFFVYIQLLTARLYWSKINCTINTVWFIFFVLCVREIKKWLWIFVDSTESDGQKREDVSLQMQLLSCKSPWRLRNPF